MIVKARDLIKLLARSVPYEQVFHITTYMCGYHFEYLSLRCTVINILRQTSVRSTVKEYDVHNLISY